MNSYTGNSEVLIILLKDSREHSNNYFTRAFIHMQVKQNLLEV